MTLNELQQMIENMQKALAPLSFGEIMEQELVSEEVAEKLLTISTYLWDVKGEVDMKLRKLEAFGE